MDLDSICASKRSYYWRRKTGYLKLQNTTVGNRRKQQVKIIRAGCGTRNTTRRLWRIKAIPKLRLKISSPFKLWTKLKNAYINLMIDFSENLGYMSATNVHLALAPKRIPMEEQVESRFVFEIYKALKAASQEPM